MKVERLVDLRLGEDGLCSATVWTTWSRTGNDMSQAAEGLHRDFQKTFNAGSDRTETVSLSGLLLNSGPTGATSFGGGR